MSPALSTEKCGLLFGLSIPSEARNVGERCLSIESNKLAFVNHFRVSSSSGCRRNDSGLHGNRTVALQRSGFNRRRLVLMATNSGRSALVFLEADSFSEFKAADTIVAIVDALNYCHDMKICHRDLKVKKLLKKL